MKIVGIVGAVLLTAFAFLAWRFVIHDDALVVVSQAPAKRVSGSVSRIVPNKEFAIEIDNDFAKNSVTSISLSRALADQLGVSAPHGFNEEPLPLSETEKRDKESADYVEKYNRETLRWTGNFPLVPNGKVVLVIPAKSPTPMSGYIFFHYEAKVGFGGSMSGFRVSLIEPTEVLSKVSTPVGKRE